MNNSALAIVEQDVWSVQEQFNRVAAGSLNFEREAGFAIQVISGNDYALRIAAENRQSVINAVTNIAAIGISLNPAKRQAYLVPRDGKICLDISYMGLLDLAIQSGSIMWGKAELVYEVDGFELNGFDRPPTHNRKPFAKDRGSIVGVYVVVKTRDGDYLTDCMSIDEVYDIRDRSSAWKAWTEAEEVPWVTDEGEMIKKTVIKRAYKTWPKTDKLDQAIHHLNTEGGEGIELSGAANDSPASGGASARDAMGEALRSMSPEAQAYMRELAGEVEAIFRNPEAGAGPAFDRIELDQLDNDQRMGLWYLLPSDVRSALKKEGDARRNAKPAGDGPVKYPKANIVRSPAYRRFVASFPCFSCGIEGHSQAAHPNTGKGMSLKTSDLDCFPLCASHGLSMGCHWLHDNSVEMTREERRAAEVAYIARMHELARAAGRPEFTLEAA